MKDLRTSQGQRGSAEWTPDTSALLLPSWFTCTASAHLPEAKRVSFAISHRLCSSVRVFLSAFKTSQLSDFDLETFCKMNN